MKRILDFSLAAGALLALSPLLLFLAALIRLTSPGPSLFRQKRIGRSFREFHILKFRSMVVDAPSRGDSITIGADPRITPLGRLLRATKMDELPQLINVLRGEMSLVGPRPEVPEYVDLYREDFAEILAVCPGMTDPASLLYRDEASVLARARDPQQAYAREVLPRKLQLAKEYVHQRTLWGDLGIVLKTVAVLCSDRFVTRGEGKHSQTKDATESTATDAVPFFRTSILDDEVREVAACLRSGWLTSGQRAKRFEADFAEFVGARHAVALNSCTAALHLGVEAMGLAPGQAVLVPAMTFAATAEIVRYQGAVPVLVDCDPVTLNLDLDDARRKIHDLARGATPLDPALKVVGIIPVHVAGIMLDMEQVNRFAEQFGLWVVEDGAHALPAAYREPGRLLWRRCGENTAAVTCFSFYANKTITTGEGGMAVTDDESLAARIRQMSLHGLSQDAWKRYAGGGSWDYRIVAPGYKYNLTDIAASIGIHQLRRAEQMRQQREALACRYLESLANVEELELPPVPDDRLHSWHLFPIRLRLERLATDRNQFIEDLRTRGIGCSVHWRPLHLHPYYRETFGWRRSHLPQASRVWERLISLPLYPDMQDAELLRVVDAICSICREHRLDQVPVRRAA